MWEYSINFSLSKQDWAYKIQDNCRQATKDCGGVSTIVVSNSGTKLLFAGDINTKYQLKPVIMQHLANYIILDYKYNYLVSKFKFKVTSDINMQAFIKALVVFDSEIDKDIIIQNLRPLSKVDIDSFCRFRLKILHTKWQDLINLANDNFVYLLSTDTFIELLKFIISNLDYRTKEVNIHFDKNGFKLLDVNNKPIQDTMLDYTVGYNDALLITSLITLSPRRINLHYDTTITNSTINLLFQLFSDRIEISK